MARVANLFIEFHEKQKGQDGSRFGTGWEDLFTKQLGFFLSADLSAATALARTLMCRTDVVVEAVSTQGTIPEGTPDLRLDLAGGGCLHVEHKFDSPLGVRQLERYLESGPLALVSRCNQSVAADALLHPNYHRPTDREYFRWSDVYEALVGGEPTPKGFGGLREYFKGYMRELGLAPTSLTSEWRRLFDERTDPANQIVQKEFGAMLDPVASELRRRGLKVYTRSHKGLEAHPNEGVVLHEGVVWHHLYVDPQIVRADFLESFDCGPFEPGYEGLVVELFFEESHLEVVRRIHQALGAERTSLSARNWYVLRPRRVNTSRVRLTLASPLVPYLASDEGISRRLAEAATWAFDRLLAAVETAWTGTAV